MWTKENRTRYNRDKLRYPSDLSDAEWPLAEPLIPPAKSGGNKRRVNFREIVNGRSKLCKQRLRRVMYVLSTGCQWRAIPKDLPPRSTVFAYLDLWIYDGTLDRMHRALYEACHEQAGREASPAACIIDRKTREKRRKREARIDPPGFDAGNPSMNTGDQGQEAAHSRRHRGIAAACHRACRRYSRSRRRRSSAGRALWLVGLFPFLKKLFADSACQGPIFHKTVGKILTHLDIEIVKRSDQAKSFVVLPKRWIVERTIAWLNRCRRLAKDWENLNVKALAFLRFASIRLMLRKLCNPS